MGRWEDAEDIAQERALAVLEGRDPDEAERALKRQEHRFYDHIAGLPPDADRLVPARAPQSLQPVSRPNRSPESIAKRLAYSRDWWRRNGRAYRASRAISPWGRG